MKKKFWNWVRNEDTGNRTLVLNGQISDETWFGDEVTPGLFRDELQSCEGDITVWINSPGGDVFAAAQIYNMLMDYKGNVTVKIDGIAASAASVIARSGDSSISQIMAMTRLKAIYITTETRSLLEKLTEIAHIIKNSRSIILKVCITSSPVP